MNSYKEQLNLDFLFQLCQEHGETKGYKKGETFISKGFVCNKIGYIQKGYFQYVISGKTNDEFITGFAFENEYVSDYPRCLYGQPSDVTIICASTAEVILIDAELLSTYYSQNIDTERIGRMISEQLFLQTYTQLHDFYNKTSEDRYRSLLARNPKIVQQISLKEIASYLRVTPTTISSIRRKITFRE